MNSHPNDADMERHDGFSSASVRSTKEDIVQLLLTTLTLLAKNDLTLFHWTSWVANFSKY